MALTLLIALRIRKVIRNISRKWDKRSSELVGHSTKVAHPGGAFKQPQKEKKNTQRKKLDPP